ncbi:hypothetical protein Hanom_Chr01g00000651 [Helianthus anomalus]
MGTKGVKAQVDEFVEVVRKPRAQNKGKAPIWQPKKTKTGPSVSEPGPSQQKGLNCGLDLGSSIINGQKKPSEKAAGLHNISEVGLVNEGLAELPVLIAGGLNNDADMGSGKVGPMETQPRHDEAFSVLKHDENDSSLNIYGLQSDPVLIENKSPKYGSGYFDVSKQNFGLGPKQGVCTKNSFGTLRDEEECFDTDLGLWEHEIDVVKKFVESNTRPKLEDYDSWSVSMKKYYDGLTKMKDDDEVASETDETARFMKSGASRLSLQIHLFVFLGF